MSGKGVLRKMRAVADERDARPAGQRRADSPALAAHLFVGVKGKLEIRYEGQHGNGLFVLKPGAFCSMPPRKKYRIQADEAIFLLMHASHETSYVAVPRDRGGAALFAAEVDR